MKPIFFIWKQIIQVFAWFFVKKTSALLFALISLLESGARAHFPTQERRSRSRSQECEWRSRAPLFERRSSMLWFKNGGSSCDLLFLRSGGFLSSWRANDLRGRDLSRRISPPFQIKATFRSYFIKFTGQCITIWSSKLLLWWVWVAYITEFQNFFS